MGFCHQAVSSLLDISWLHAQYIKATIKLFFGHVAGNDHDTTCRVATFPRRQRYGLVKDVLNPMEHERPFHLIDMHDPLHPEDIGAFEGDQHVQPKIKDACGDGFVNNDRCRCNPIIVVVMMVVVIVMMTVVTMGMIVMIVSRSVIMVIVIMVIVAMLAMARNERFVTLRVPNPL